ncbi:MAG: hypothetical protein ACI9CU_000927 [Polaribacter sp.]|jgi:hypothetical protein
MRKFQIGRIVTTLTFTLMVLVFSGCFKDDFDFDRMRQDMITWEPDIAIPLVYSTINTEKLIGFADTTNIYEYDSDNFITLIYRKRIFSQTINDIFQFPAQQQLDQSIELNAVEIGQFTVNNTIEKTINGGITFSLTGPSGSAIDKMQFQTGNMNISFTSNFEHSGFLEISMPEMRLNGIPFLQTYPINYTSGTVSLSIDIPLAQYEMDMDNGMGPNTIPINYTLTLNQGAGSTPTPFNQVNVSHSFEDMVMSFTDGYFGNFNLEVNPSEVDLDVIQGDHNGRIYFEDPRFKLRITNTIGADIDVNIDDLYAIGGPNPQLDIDLSSQIPGNQFSIPGAPSFGDSSISEFYFTQNNSNIKEVINDEYHKIFYDLSGEVNPVAGPVYNFAGLNSAIEVIADIELPFWGFSDHFTIIDTIEVPFNEAEDFADNIERGLLRINTLSHFPVDGLLKLYFADTAYNLIDSVLTDGTFLISSGLVNSDGKVISAVNTNNDIELDSARIHNLFASSFLLLSVDITTTDDANRNIKLYLEDNIEVRIGLRAKLKAQPSDINDF